MSPTQSHKEFFENTLWSGLPDSVHSAKPSVKTTGFVERSILNVIEFIKGAIANDEIASRKGFLQACDPRLKCLSIVLLLCGVCISRSYFVLICYYMSCLFMSICSSIRTDFFLKRTLLFIPLFSFFIVVPAIFNIVTPGTAVVSFTVFSMDLSITRQGIDSALIFFFRVLASVSLVILLMLTTRQYVLLKVLRIFKVPQFFVMTLGMCYRYIFLLLDIVQKTVLTIKSRVGYVSSTKTGRRIVGAHMAGLWLRSYRLHSEIYTAMLSRGYTGEPLVLVEFRARIIDAVFFIISCCVLIGTIWMNRFFH